MQEKSFRCEKCGYYSPLGKDLQLKNNKVLCSICVQFAPSSQKDFEGYSNEKIDGDVLDSFRKYQKNKKDNLKNAMTETAKKGKIVSRPPFGYGLVKGELIPAQNKEEVREIFESFAKGSSLNSIANMHNLSVNGVKKILKNFTYIGKIKFDSQILPGNHQSLIDFELFNRVQKIFEKNK